MPNPQVAPTPVSFVLTFFLTAQPVLADGCYGSYVLRNPTNATIHNRIQ